MGAEGHQLCDLALGSARRNENEGFEARGSGVISLNGKMVDKPVVIRAQRVIELALVAGIITKEEVEAL